MSGHATSNDQLFAVDALQVLKALEIERTDVIGWSDGGVFDSLLGLVIAQGVCIELSLSMPIFIQS